MKRTGLILSLIYLILVNIVVLTGVYSNRNGILDASIELTERELPLAWTRHTDENTGVAFKLNWNQLQQDWSWLDKNKLVQAGIDIDVLKTDVNTSHWYPSLPVFTYAVLEYDGPVWEEFRENRIRERNGLKDQVTDNRLSEEAAERRRKEINAELNLASRLFIVDVGTSPDRLRRDHPDRQRYMILPAEIRAARSWSTPGAEDKNPAIRGHVNILIDTLHVAKEFHSTLDKLPDKGRIYPYISYSDTNEFDVPRYRVQINNGARYEPWVVSIDEVHSPAVSAE